MQKYSFSLFPQKLLINPLILLKEAAEYHVASICSACDGLLHGFQSYPCRIFLRITVNAGAYARKGNGVHTAVLSQFQCRGVARSEQLRLTMSATMPHRSHGVYYLPARQTVGIRHLALARPASSERATLRQKLPARSPVYGSVDSATAKQRIVGGVHYGVNLQSRDVTRHHSYSFSVVFHNTFKSLYLIQNQVFIYYKNNK